MKQLAFLEYKFLFDPSESFSSLHEFESTLGEFFRERGFEAEVVKTIEGRGGRLLILRKIHTPELKDSKPKGNKSVSSQLKKMRGH